MTAAERGSAVHKALGLLPYEPLRAAGMPDEALINALLDRLRANEQLTAQERKAVQTGQMVRFFASELDVPYDKTYIQNSRQLIPGQDDQLSVRRMVRFH